MSHVDVAMLTLTSHSINNHDKLDNNSDNNHNSTDNNDEGEGIKEGPKQENGDEGRGSRRRRVASPMCVFFLFFFLITGVLMTICN